MVNLEPELLDKYVFYCWECKLQFREYFERVVKVSARTVTQGCYKRYVFLGEHYSSYSLNSLDTEKRRRWRLWAEHFRRAWCPKHILAPEIYVAQVATPSICPEL